MTPRQQIRTFNANIPVGSVVALDDHRQTTTRATAQLLHDGRAVVWLADRLGAVDLSSIEIDAPVLRKKYIEALAALG